MALDGLSCHLLVTELQSLLIGGRVQKSYLINKQELLLNIHNRENYKLLFNIDAANYRFHLTEEDYRAPFQAPNFTMLIRKHFQGGILLAIQQNGLERIVEFVFEAKDDLGNPIEKSLIAEMMGKYSNLIIVETETRRIIDSLVRVPFGLSSVRQVLPGMTYTPPPQVGLLLCQEDSSDNLNDYLGISPLVAGEMHYRFPNPQEAVNELCRIYREKDFTPQISYGDKKSYCGVMPYTHLADEFATYPSMNKTLEQYYLQTGQRQELQKTRQELLRVVNQNLKSLNRTISKQEKEIEKAQAAEEFKRLGDLLKANLYQIPPGQSTVEVIDYYSDMQKVNIEINGDKTPQQNLQNFYRRYEKLMRTREHVNEQLERNNSEVSYLEGVRRDIESNDELSGLLEIKLELTEGKYMQAESKSKSKRQTTHDHSRPRQYFIDGFRISVGKNNLQNDQLTMRTAKKDDIWLHAKDIPGSHVIIHTHQGDTPMEVLLFAANLAAYYSKFRDSAQVPVDYTLIKHVTKPRHARPGQVNYREHKTLYITPHKPPEESQNND